jgi:hypothetical protein
MSAPVPDIGPLGERASGYGQDGPYAPRAGCAAVGEALGGLRASHTDDVLVDVLGMDRGRIAELRDAGIVGGKHPATTDERSTTP